MQKRNGNVNNLRWHYFRVPYPLLSGSLAKSSCTLCRRPSTSGGHLSEMSVKLVGFREMLVRGASQRGPNPRRWSYSQAA